MEKLISEGGRLLGTKEYPTEAHQTLLPPVVFLQKTFENFEEKFAFPPLEGHHITTPVSSVGESRIKEPVSSASSSRTKRRHTEPSTMADFVTSIPGKRPKHYLGIPSDSDDLLSPHDIQ